MTVLTAEVIMNCIIIGAALLSVVYSLGVVWRVEKELDISFKLFSAAIISFSISEIAKLFSIDGIISTSFISTFLKLLFAIFFFLGIFTMRDLARKMDGEKNPDDVIYDTDKK